MAELENRGDTFTTLLCLLGKGKKITWQRARTHIAIYQLKQEYPNYFKAYLFDTNGTDPTCATLNEEFGRLSLLGTLQTDDMLAIRGPRADYKIMIDATEERKASYTPQELEDLGEIARKLFEEVGIS